MILGGEEKVLVYTFVFGQTLDLIILHTHPNCLVLSLIFHPHILPSVFPLHAKELTDERLVDHVNRIGNISRETTLYLKNYKCSNPFKD